jgi:RHS repeat-associated protein
LCDVVLHRHLLDANDTAAAQLGAVYEQYRYWPYGAFAAVDEDHNSDDILAVIDFANDPELLSTPLGHQGLFRDQETGSIHNRGRDYDPALSRFRQRDPNETALLLATALVRNGQAADALSGVPGSGLYSDGLHLYIYQRGNPLIGNDPAALFTFGEMMSNMFVKSMLMYDMYDTGMSLKRMISLVATAISTRNLSQDTLAEFASEGGWMALDLLAGPAADLVGRSLRYARQVAKKRGFAKSTVAGLAEIGKRRKDAQRLMAEALEQGAKMQRHHMVPKQLLDMLKESPKYSDVYKALRGKPGDKNIWMIPENLHKYLHSDKMDGWKGGWWNRVWVEAFDEMKQQRLPSSKIIEQLQAIRTVALDQLGIRELVDRLP